MYALEVTKDLQEGILLKRARRRAAPQRLDNEGAFGFLKIKVSQYLGVCIRIRMESDFAHGMGNFSILHEALPNKAAAEVFCHQHTDTDINANHVVAIPP